MTRVEISRAEQSILGLLSIYTYTYYTQSTYLLYTEYILTIHRVYTYYTQSNLLYTEYILTIHRVHTYCLLGSLRIEID